MRNSQLTFPVTNFRHIVQACRADEALEPSDPRFLDLTDLRDGSSVVDELAELLQQVLEEGEFQRFILSGHRGSGKSTELLQLKAWADANGFLCLRVEVDTYLGNTQLEFSDLYLLAAQSVVKGMEEVGNPLPPAKIERVVQWFAEVTQQHLESTNSKISVQTEAEAGGGIPLLGKLLARFSASVMAGSEHQLEVRRTFRQAPDELIDMTNDLIRTANAQLRSVTEPSLRREAGLLLIFDNLDRYPVESIESLLTQGATLMRHLKCHATYTIPVELRCRAGNIYWDEYDADVILPMPVMRHRDQPWGDSIQQTQFNDAAVALLRKLLEQRLDTAKLFEQEDDVTLLVKMRGGCVRDLMHLVVGARRHSNSRDAEQPTLKITASGVQRAIRNERDNRAEGLLEEDYKRLVEVARDVPKAQQMDEAALRLLKKRYVLQYVDEKGRWLDVHPLLLETEGFRRAWNTPGIIPPTTIGDSNDE